MADSDSTQSNGVPGSIRPYSAATNAVHADDALRSSIDIAPPIHVATTFDYDSDPDSLVPSHLSIVRSFVEQLVRR